MLTDPFSTRAFLLQNAFFILNKKNRHLLKASPVLPTLAAFPVNNRVRLLLSQSFVRGGFINDDCCLRITIYEIHHIRTPSPSVEINGLSPRSLSREAIRVPGVNILEMRACAGSLGSCVDEDGLEREDGCDEQRRQGDRFHIAVDIKKWIGSGCKKIGQFWNRECPRVWPCNEFDLVVTVSTNSCGKVVCVAAIVKS